MVILKLLFLYIFIYIVEGLISEDKIKMIKLKTLVIIIGYTSLVVTVILLMFMVNIAINLSM